MGPLEHYGITLREDNFHEGAIYGLACAYSLMEKEVTDFLRPYNLTPAKFNAMMVIKHRGVGLGLSQIEIGRRLIVSASNMTRLLDKLEVEGFIERMAQEGDRRINRIRISKKGSDILDKVWPGYYQKITNIANLLSISQQKQLSGLLTDWCGKLELKPQAKLAALNKKSALSGIPIKSEGFNPDKDDPDYKR